MKKLSTFLINSLVAAGLFPTADRVLASTSPDLTAKKDSTPTWNFQKIKTFTLATHRSHSSHRSHGSHRSHRSSSGGGSAPSTTPSYTPPPVKNYDTSSGTYKQNNDSTSPNSILPSSPATSPKVTKINGNSKDFKLLVMQVQLRLFAKGLYNSSIDGIGGPDTSAAISKYELMNKLPVTGRLSDKLLEHLNIDIEDVVGK